MKVYKCNKNGCNVNGVIDDDNVPCMNGDPFNECPHLEAYDEDEIDSAVNEQRIGFDEYSIETTFFSNDVLRYDQIKYFSLENEPIIATIIGLPDVGKTSLLVSFLYALRMKNESELEFMGSYTLNGWSVLIDKTHYAYGETPYHPDRTINHEYTQYLHLLIKSIDGVFDVLLGDTAGEVFSNLVDYSHESVEYEKTVKWVSEAQVIILCLDSSEYYYDNLWIAKENHTKLVDNILEIIELHNQYVKIIFVETKSDLINSESDGAIYHKEVNDYFYEKLGKYIIGHCSTVSITHRQGEIPQESDKVLKYCVDILKYQSQPVIKNETYTFIYEALGDWLK